MVVDAPSINSGLFVAWTGRGELREVKSSTNDDHLSGVG